MQQRLQDCECPLKSNGKLYHIEQGNNQCTTTTNSESNLGPQQHNYVPINGVQYLENYYNPQLITECSCVSKLCNQFLQCHPVNSANEFYSNIMNVPATESQYGLKQQNQLFHCVPIDNAYQTPFFQYNNPQKQIASTTDRNTCCSQQSVSHPVESTSQLPHRTNPNMLQFPMTTECCVRQQQPSSGPTAMASQYIDTYYNIPQNNCDPCQQSVDNKCCWSVVLSC